MRRRNLLLLFLLTLPACHEGSKPSDSKPSEAGASDSKPSDSKPSDSKPSDSKPSDAPPVVSKGVVASTPPIGVLVGPATPTVGRVRARSCAASTPSDLGSAGELAPLAAAFGQAAGLVAWSPNAHRLTVRPIDRQGRPTAPQREINVIAPLARSWGLRALANHYIAFLSATDYSGSSPRIDLFALVLDKNGSAIGSPLKIDIGNRGMLDAISDGASNGVVIYAGATPATNVRTARQITVYVAADGAISQSLRDYPDLTPGDRALPKFAFSAEHTVTLLPQHVIVDGELRESKDDPAIEGLLVAPRFTGTKVPLIGYPKILDDKKRRYGTLTLDGKRTYEKVIDTKPVLRAPFEKLVTWNEGSGSSGVSVTTLDRTINLSFPGISSGIGTKTVWSGEQALVLYTAGTAVRIAPLPCN